MTAETMMPIYCVIGFSDNYLSISHKIDHKHSIYIYTSHICPLKFRVKEENYCDFEHYFYYR